ncbi:hypothetical protein RUM43_004465 [Polyplax serrata]|uniref:Uncharacterized protein n=1 Tax=Polyplax serrata TaxID=468196 RepID=A0AAN8SAV6_POLSC
MDQDNRSLDDGDEDRKFYGEDYPEWGGESPFLPEPPIQQAEEEVEEKSEVVKEPEHLEKRIQPVVQSKKFGPVAFECPGIFDLVFGPPKLPPKFNRKLPDPLTHTDEDYTESDLFKLRLNDCKTKKIYQYLQFAGTKKKIEIYYERILEEDVAEIPKKKRHYERLLREYAASIPVVPLQQSWIDSILAKLHNLHLKFPAMAASIMNEVKEDFAASMHQFGIDALMKCLPGESKKVHQLSIVEEVGRTPRYHLYLMHREMLKTRLHLLHKFQRKIFTLCIKTLPEVLVDFRRYRSMGFLDLVQLENNFNADLKKSEHIVTTSLYPKVVSLISRKRALNDIPVGARGKYLASATNILAVQITQLIQRSIDHILMITQDVELAPCLDLELIYDEGISLSPSETTIFQTFHNFITSMCSIAQELTALEQWVDKVPVKEKTIKIIVNESYLNDVHKTLDENMENLFSPINAYLDKLDLEYSGLYSEELVYEINMFIDENHTFEEVVEKREHFQGYVDKINDMVVNQYFSLCRLCQVSLIQTLRDFAFAFCDDLLGEMIRTHGAVNLEICRTFEQLKMRALKIPETSEELMESGTYMVWANTTLMVELKEKITRQLFIVGRLIELTEIPVEYSNIMSTTVNWLSDIKPIFEINSSMYEQYKGEFEERIHKRTETLIRELEDLGPKLAVLDNMDDIERLPSYLEEIRKLLRDLEKFDDDVKWINKEEAIFKFSISVYPELDELKNFINPFAKLLFTCHRWRRKYRLWMDGSFEDLNAEEVERTTDDFYKEILKTSKVYKAKIKQQTQENNPRRFKGNLDDPDPNMIPTPLKVCNKTLDQIKGFRTCIQIVGILCNPALTQRHWDEMSEICGFDITPDYGTTLRKVVGMELEEYLDKFEIISVGACKELQLMQNLHKMWGEWEGVKFSTSQYKETNIYILSGLDDIQALLDDHLVKAMTMRGSAFVKPFETEVKEWYEKLNRVNKTIDEWGKVQVQWLYLLPIFSSKDIVAQMPEEGSLFQEVDAVYKRLMLSILRDPLVLNCAGAQGVLEVLIEQTQSLEKINDGVNNYLEKKRLYFPRFFFLSNDEMLEILSETKDPLRVQPHLRKCFEGIAKLGFDHELNIYSMISAEGEQIMIVSTISTEEARGAVEKWLLQVEEQMLLTVREVAEKAYKAYLSTDRTIWVREWPGQVVICVSTIFWTLEVHEQLNKGDVKPMKVYHEGLQVQLNQIVALVRGKLSKQNRVTLGALVVIDVHAKDVVEELILANITSDNDFSWLAQLRYYWEDDCIVRITNATVKYAYEYLGNTPRLVITPLTDRCYRTLVGAYHLHLNGAPEGPAGTGKTETTKDLAKALAVQCVVFNCSDGLDYIAMGKFFKGLASSGAWACFDEFNRIELEVLSVIAQQILCIVQAVQGNLKTFIFEGTELTLNPSCYVCITMNPGYAGRSELPDNLKVLFRTVAMMVPDYALIGEISLYSYGFVKARVLSVKIVTTYRLCSEQLSSQFHYDYGMRAVKTVLQAAGNLKLKFPDENEDILLLRSIIDVNLPKFLNHDVPLFEGIISDLFPGVVLPVPDYGDFLETVNIVCANRVLQPVPSFKTKLIQTYEMMIVRHGFMLVGDPFGGKTSTLHVLADTLTMMNEKGFEEEKVQFVTINPKSITMGQLYGQFDPVSYEWSDGIVATSFRGFVQDPSPDRKWIIFDGPVDAVWIENMNTVLDDNKKLCLNSGEVMAMTNSMSMIFEVMDLAQASPATVSRCGMIYLEPETLGWRPLVKSWIKKQNRMWMEGNEELVNDIFEWLVPPSLTFTRKQCNFICNAGVANRVNAMMTIVQMLINEACTPEKRGQDVDLKNLNIWFQAAFIYAGVWGLGGGLDLQSRILFNEFYIDIWRGNDTYPVPESLGKIDISIPGEGLLHDYCYVFKAKGSWKYWPEALKSEKLEETINISQMLVPTVDTVKYQYLLELHIKHNMSTLLVGGTGTGKSFYIQNLLMYKLSQELFLPAFITFTASISANQTQDLVISKLNKKKRGRYGPPTGKRCVIFVDDMNMPAKEVYGAQPPIELLRQYFDCKHWYDLKDTSKIYIFDVLFMAAMGLPGGSRQEVYARFLRHFNIFSICDFSDESMIKIFSSVLLVGLKRNGFATDVMSSVVSIVHATLDVYQSAMLNLRPTPAKSHYIFNLRDFARVVQGCSLVRKESVDSKKFFAKLWVHEILRVFYDRLVEDTDRNWLYEKLRSCVREHLKEIFDQLFDNLPLENGVCTQETLRNLMFGSYMDPDALEEERKYEEIPSAEAFQEVAMRCMDDYNATHKTKLDIVLFRYALEHLSRICRILAIPSGSGLLVGVGGSGRQSLCKLATTILNYNIFQPEITKNYGSNDWREDLKRVLKEAGGKAKNTTFLFSEGQIKEESFLLDIDALLNSGEVPNLFAIDEKQEILEMVRLAAQGGNRNLDISPLAVFSFFISQCKQKLHVMLCFSPIGASFRNRLRLYPSFVNCCTIDWFVDWPEDALEMIGKRWMENVNLSEDIKNSSIVACKYFHVTAKSLSAEFFQKTNRKTYITSSAFLELIVSFTKFTNAKQDEIMAAKMRYIGGLEKLDFAAAQVAEMSKELSALKPKLVVAAKETMEMMQTIEKETIKVEKATALVKEDEKVANVQAAAAAELKAECEADLAEAVPILEEAIAALNTLKPADITLVKSMKNPPDAVKLVMAAVCVMKNVKPDKLPDPATGRKILDYWGPSKRILGDMAFLQSLKDYDKDNIPEEIMTKIRKEYLPHKDFKPHVVAKASSAAEGLCKWIIAMDLYDAVAKEVAPKKAKLEIAESEFSKTMELLGQKKAQVDKLESELRELMEKLKKAQDQKQALEDDVNLCSNKLTRAEKLIGGLGGEKSRWTLAATSLQKDYDSLAGDILVSCGVIAYLSPFTMNYRAEKMHLWQSYCKSLNIPSSDEYVFSKIMGSDIKIQNWNIYGLPRDQFSSDNGIIMDTSRRWSLFIDPQSQANKWIKAMEKANDLKVCKFSDSNYMKIVEMSVELGKPVLIENILEELEAPLEPLLVKSTFVQGGKTYISLGDNVIEYSPKFKLYMTSKLRNPHYLPEVYNRVTVINFALTIDGLEDQLLGIVVAKERPDLQETRQELIVQSANNRKALKDVEDMILKTLSGTKGNILEDESAIEVLDSSKTLSKEILEKQEAAKETEQMIESFRMSYRPIAAHSAVLYYCITDLPNVDPMYQYSLGWFINLYIISIETANKSKILEKRLAFLHETFTYNLYSNVCRSLFEKDKLLFSLLLCCNVMISKNLLTKTEFMFLLTGGVGLENTVPNPAPSWFSEKSWDELCRVNEFADFKGIVEHFRQSTKEWQQFYDLPNPTYDQIPNPWRSKLSSFQNLILIRIFRPDKIVINVTKFVDAELGTKFTKPPAFDIAKSYNDSNCLCPLIFILSPGADPMNALTKFAQKMGFSGKFQSISLGQGQGPIASRMIEQAQMDGGWVCLQNCHLAVSWMPTLEKTWESFDTSNTALTFRLWLTSYPSDKFPPSILQYGVKMTNEPPTGLQPNLARSYASEPVKDPEFFEGCPGKDKIFGKLLYGICFFHAVVQERRKYGAIGWNIPYGFNESDFQISVKQMQMFLNEYDYVPYKAITYLTGECNYGGRVTDDWDRRCINTILKDFVNSNVVSDPAYTFCPLGPAYGLPRKTEYRDYVNHINNIPMVPPPEVFGLHTNAGITRDLQNTKNLFTTMLLIQEESSGGDSSSDSLLLDIAKDILSKLPKNFDLELAITNYPVTYTESMNTVLVQEMERFNRLLSVVRSTLQALQKAIKGLVVMTPALDTMATSLQFAKVPAVWAKVSYPSLKKLGAYVNDFVERLNFLQKWHDMGKPSQFWLSGFFFTQAFLTGAMQNFARKYRIPIDQLTFDFEVTNVDVKPKPPIDGVYVYGMFVDGARWDRKAGNLEEQLIKILYDVLPVVWLKPIEKTKLQDRGRYKSPLYKTSERRGTLSTTGHSTNYVLPFLLETKKPVSHWIKRGTALLCQLDD